MDVGEIEALGPALDRYLGEFGDCFGRVEPRGHLRTYAEGQLSDLPRKTVEPVALAAGVPPPAPDAAAVPVGGQVGRGGDAGPGPADRRP